MTVLQSDFGSQPLDEIKFGEPITIKVSVKFTDVSWLPPMYYNGLIEESTTMRKEGEE